jgi:cyanophycinase-like exopeptidase
MGCIDGHVAARHRNAYARLAVNEAIVYLMAGAGPATSRRHVRYHRECVRATGKRRPRIAYVGAAANDSRAFSAMAKSMIFGPSADIVEVELTRKSSRTSVLRADLGAADMVFFMGGDVDRGMALVDDRGLGPYVRRLAAEGMPMEGVSAGSIMLGSHWVRFSDDDDATGEAFRCLGVVPRSFDTHAEDDEWQELHSLARLLARRKTQRWVYGIASGGCALFEGGAVRALGKPLVRVGCRDVPRRMADVAVG